MSRKDGKSICTAKRLAESSSLADAQQMAEEPPPAKDPAAEGPLGKTKEGKQKDPCALPMDEGACLQYVVLWYFHPETETCRPFIYGGCGGNANQFPSKQSCEGRCKRGKGR
ncbi:kunitz-type serine protease inhibitor HNTX-852-like [Pantherophis guttatus]|uniref:Kunitz-type serine protease inhibitor HNTX-852-like n=1 Tax=Pantherophis guttatus TaxID=94885 RepID=A0ABM3Z3S4_PANGU|nr:kunitz-type serine protease inhibitor HNTX-852-like [Pantherophis guttatus]